MIPMVWTSPPGDHLLLADPVSYPPLAELAARKHELAGMRVEMVVQDGEEPTAEMMGEIREKAAELVELALERKQ